MNCNGTVCGTSCCTDNPFCTVNFEYDACGTQFQVFLTEVPFPPIWLLLVQYLSHGIVLWAVTLLMACVVSGCQLFWRSFAGGDALPPGWATFLGDTESSYSTYSTYTSYESVDLGEDAYDEDYVILGDDLGEGMRTPHADAPVLRQPPIEDDQEDDWEEIIRAGAANPSMASQPVTDAATTLTTITTITTSSSTTSRTETTSNDDDTYDGTYSLGSADSQEPLLGDEEEWDAARAEDEMQIRRFGAAQRLAHILVDATRTCIIVVTYVANIVKVARAQQLSGWQRYLGLCVMGGNLGMVSYIFTGWFGFMFDGLLHRVVRRGWCPGIPINRPTDSALHRRLFRPYQGLMTRQALPHVLMWPWVWLVVVAYVMWMVWAFVGAFVVTVLVLSFTVFIALKGREGFVELIDAWQGDRRASWMWGVVVISGSMSIGVALDMGVVWVALILSQEIPYSAAHVYDFFLRKGERFFVADGEHLLYLLRYVI